MSYLFPARDYQDETKTEIMKEFEGNFRVRLGTDKDGDILGMAEMQAEIDKHHELVKHFLSQALDKVEKNTIEKCISKVVSFKHQSRYYSNYTANRIVEMFKQL